MWEDNLNQSQTRQDEIFFHKSNKKKALNKMLEMNSNVLIILIRINALNPPVKRLAKSCNFLFSRDTPKT